MIAELLLKFRLSQKSLNFLELHLAVLLFGFAGLFGKLLPLSPFTIVLGRTLFAWLTLGLLLVIRRIPLRLPCTRDYVFLAFLGALLALHWTCFFYAIQLSTVAIGLLTYAAFPFFVTFLEPLIFHECLKKSALLWAFVVCLGLVLIVPEFSLQNMTTLGILMGSLSGFCFAFLSIFNRRAVQQLSAVRIALYENFFAFLLLLPWLQMRVSMLTFGHIRLLIILGVLCTALAHWLFIESLKRLRTQIASLIAALEPVYGILIALLILREVPEPRTLLGGLIIIFAALFISITY